MLFGFCTSITLNPARDMTEEKLFIMFIYESGFPSEKPQPRDLGI